MKIICSRCLLGINCKYNGGNNDSQALHSFIQKHNCSVISVCPEVEGGLPVPRIPSEIRNGEVINREGQSVDSAFRKGAEKCMETVRKENPDLVILQSRSPSCGLKEVYDGTFSGVRIKGSGIFADMVKKEGYPVIDIEDLKE